MFIIIDEIFYYILIKNYFHDHYTVCKKFSNNIAFHTFLIEKFIYISYNRKYFTIYQLKLYVNDKNSIKISQNFLTKNVSSLDGLL